MSRVQLALNVDNLDEAVAFYSKLFGAEPAYTFGTSPELLAADQSGGCSCDSADQADTEPSGTKPDQPAPATACC